MGIVMNRLLTDDERTQLLANGEAAKFCDQLSDILRDFLLQRYGLGSRRLISSELLEELGARGIPVGVLSHVEAIVTSCDLVKFAKVRLGAHELTEALTATYVVLDLADLDSRFPQNESLFDGGFD